MAQRGVQQRVYGVAPSTVDFEKTERFTYLVRCTQRHADMTGFLRRAGELVPVSYLELEPRIQLAEIVQKRQNSQASRCRGRETVSARRLRESSPQYRIQKQRLETSRDVRTVVFETMEVVRRLELSPCIHV